MKKTRWNESKTEKFMWTELGIIFVLIMVLRSVYDEFRAAESLFRQIPTGETLQTVEMSLFKISVVTDRAEYVSQNAGMIMLAVFLGISVAALLVTVAVDLSVREKNNGPDKPEEDSPSDDRNNA